MTAKLLPDAWVPDVLQPGLKLVFCGTALGHKSAQARAYYANPGNQFWAALHRIGLTPSQLHPQDYMRVLEYGIGLTDLCKTHSGQDADLPVDALDRLALEQKILLHQPQLLAFTSKQGASAYMQKPTGKIPYGLQAESIGPTKIFVLSSPSGLARKWWREDVWQELGGLVRALA